MKRFKEIWSDEEGSSLSSVLIIAVIILTFIGAILSGVILQARFIQRDINQTQSLYLAEQQLFEFLSDISKLQGEFEVPNNFPIVPKLRLE